MAELSIGELARRCGRTVHTLRWYESQGLVPGVQRKLEFYGEWIATGTRPPLVSYAGHGKPRKRS